MKRFFASLGIGVLANGTVLMVGTAIYGFYKLSQFALTRSGTATAFFDYLMLAGGLVGLGFFIAELINYKEQD